MPEIYDKGNQGQVKFLTKKEGNTGDFATLRL